MKTEKIEILNLADLLEGIRRAARQSAKAAKAEFDDAFDDAIDVESTLFRYPEPVRAIFNVKTEETVTVEATPGEKPVKAKKRLERPVLASKVFFNDGTWTVVKNSAEDPIELVTKDGVETASDASKERAIVYAWVKRLCGTQHPATGEVTGANLGRRLSKVVAASEDKALSKAAKAKAKAAKAKAVKTEKHGEKCRCGKREEANLQRLISDVSELVQAWRAWQKQENGPKGA